MKFQSSPARRIPNGLPWALAIVAGVSAGFHLWKVPSFVPIMREELGISLADSGLLVGVVQLAGVIGGLVFGILIDIIGVRRSLLIGLGVLSAASIAGGFVNNFGALVTLRALESFGYMLTIVAAPALIRREVTGHALTRAMGWWASYQGISSGVGLAAAALLMSVVSRQVWWLVLGVVSLLVAIAIFLVVQPDPPREQRRTARQIMTSIAHTVRASAPWLVGLTFTAYASGWIAVIGFLPTIYDDAGVDPLIGGLLTAAASAANILGTLIGAQLLRVGAHPQWLVWTGMGGMAVLGWAVFAAGLPFGLAIVAVMAFSAIGGLVPVVLVRLSVETAPPTGSVPVAIGLVQQLANLGMFIGPIIAGGLADATGGWDATWWFNVAVALVASVLIVLATTRRFGVGDHLHEQNS